MEGITMIPMLRNKGISSMPSLIDAFLGDDFPVNFLSNSSSGTLPSVNIVEGKDDYSIDVAAPGLEKKDFKVDVDNNLLTISCEKESKNELKDERVMRREFSYTAFKRSFTLPESVDSDKIKATYKEGILRISVPKREEAKQKPVRQISIS